MLALSGDVTRCFRFHIIKLFKYKKRYVKLFTKYNISKNGAFISLGTLKWRKKVTPIAQDNKL